MVSGGLLGAVWEPSRESGSPSKGLSLDHAAEHLACGQFHSYRRPHDFFVAWGKYGPDPSQRCRVQLAGRAMTSGPSSTSALIAGQVPLIEVMAELHQERPVFHSEADLQHSFARALWRLAPTIESRLEVSQHVPDTPHREHLDLLCIGPSARTAIEFKYFKARWAGAVGPLKEEYVLTSHAATDRGRLGFVSDIARLERFADRPGQNGLALLVTNERSLWMVPPPHANQKTRDHDFRIHEGRTLAGELLWADGNYKRNARTLRGNYHLSWQPYSEQDGRRGEFRYLAVFTKSGSLDQEQGTSVRR